MFVNHGHPTGNTERLSNKTNQQISCCQTTIQEFGRRMEGRFLVNGNKDKRINKKCCDVKCDVKCWLARRHSILWLQCELNKFEDVKFMTNSPAIWMHITIKINVRPQMQTYFKIFKLNCVISNNISCCNKQSRFI